MSLVYYRDMLQKVYWYDRPLEFFTLFIPAGCPLSLLPLFVLIEFISYLTWYVSLGLRLAANIVVGHLLLNISGYNYGQSFFNFKQKVTIYQKSIFIIYGILILLLNVCSVYFNSPLFCLDPDNDSLLLNNTVPSENATENNNNVCSTSVSNDNSGHGDNSVNNEQEGENSISSNMNQNDNNTTNNNTIEEENNRETTTEYEIDPQAKINELWEKMTYSRDQRFVLLDQQEWATQQMAKYPHGSPEYKKYSSEYGRCLYQIEHLVEQEDIWDLELKQYDSTHLTYHEENDPDNPNYPGNRGDSD